MLSLSATYDESGDMALIWRLLLNDWPYSAQFPVKMMLKAFYGIVGRPDLWGKRPEKTDTDWILDLKFIFLTARIGYNINEAGNRGKILPMLRWEKETREMIFSAEKTYIEIPTRNCHAGTIARMNGATYLAWFGGTRESDPDVDIFYTFQRGDRFAPAVRVSAGGTAHWNPVLFPRDGMLDLYFKVGPSVPEWHTLRVRIDTAGKVAVPPAELVQGDRRPRGPVKNKCLRLRSGRILAPCSIETDDPVRWDPWIDISDDGGRSFMRMVPIPLFREREKMPENRLKPWCIVRNAGAIQPALWQSGDGSIHAFMRSTEGHILRSDSADDGETWCPAYLTDLPNNNSGIDLVATDDGQILLCLNPVSGNWAARSPLSLYVSRDDGASFFELIRLETEAGEYSYPSMVWEQGTVYLVYTWNRCRMAYWEIRLEPRGGRA